MDGALPSTAGDKKPGSPSAELPTEREDGVTPAGDQRPTLRETPLPQGFDDQQGSWRSVQSDDPFERLLLDPSGGPVPSDVVDSQTDALLAFWNQKLAAFSQGASRDQLLRKFADGNEELFRSYPERIRSARVALADEAKQAAVLAERDRRRVAAARAQLDGLVALAVADGRVARSEADQILTRGCDVGLTRDEALAYLAERLTQHDLEVEADDAAGEEPAAAPVVVVAEGPAQVPRWARVVIIAVLAAGLTGGAYMLSRPSGQSTQEVQPVVSVPVSLKSEPTPPPTPKPPPVVAVATEPTPPPPVVAPPIVTAPGLPIDCGAPARRAHDVVCGSSALRGLDSDVETTFAQVVTARPAFDRDTLRDEQYRWRQQRDRCDQDTAESVVQVCLEGLYRTRLEGIRSLLPPVPTPAAPPPTVTPPPPVIEDPPPAVPPVSGGPSPGWTGATSGTATYNGPPVVHNGEAVFRGLPPGALALEYDRGSWEHRLEPGEGNTQRLVMRNKKPGSQRRLVVTWRIVK